ncbi:MAG: sulfatase [Thermodesulfobacteriota bacterium]
MRLLRLVCVLLVAGALALGIRAERASTGRPRPNVLLVSIDSLRADHLGSYGYERPTSPTIDRLASEGALFEKAIAPAPWTVPSHMTMLTALPPEVHGVTSHRKALSPAAVTLAEVLRRAGYATAAFVSGPTVMAHYGFAQGFTVFDESTAERDSYRSQTGITSPALVELVGDYLEEWDREGRRAPFFVFLHMWDVHYDYAPPAPFDRMFDPDYAGGMSFTDFERNQGIQPNMDPRDLQHLVALYDGEIRWTDENLGRVIDRLRELGVLDDTIVVVTSDHGDEFFEHGLKGHSKTLYDEVLHVPLVVRYPRRIPFGRRVPEQVRLMDVAPTIVGLAGVEPPERFGVDREEMPAPYGWVDLTPWIARRTPRAFAQELPAFSMATALFGPQWSMRTNAGKLIRFASGRGAELYDLAHDPRERDNLYGSGNEGPLLQVLAPGFEDWQGIWKVLPARAVERTPSRTHEARLRALGYVE